MSKKNLARIALALCAGLLLCPVANAVSSITYKRSIAASDSFQIESSVRGQVYRSALDLKNHYTQTVHDTSEVESLLGISFLKSQIFDALTKHEVSTLQFDHATSAAIAKTTYTQHCFKDSLRLTLEAVSVWNAAFSDFSEYLIFHNDGQTLQQTGYLSSGMNFQLFNWLDDNGSVVEQYVLFEDSATAYTLHVITADGSAIPQALIYSILDDFAAF